MNTDLTTYERQLGPIADPVAAFTAFADPRGAALLGRHDGSATLVLDPLLRVVGRGDTVSVVACAEGASEVFATLGRALDKHGRVTIDAETLRFVPRPAAPALDEETRLLEPSPLDVLRALVLAEDVGPADPAHRTIVGALPYDLIDAFETLPAARRGERETLDMVVPALALEVGVQGRGARLVLTVPRALGPAARSRALGRFGAMAARIAAFTPPPLMPLGSFAIEAELDDERFAAMVETLQDAVRAGEVFQVVPSRAFRVRCADPLTALRRLHALNPSRYAFALLTPERALFGCSPETALRVDGPIRRAVLTPLAGTRARHFDAEGRADPERDMRALAELHLDPKELAEHLMLVDLARNDLARIGVAGTRRVTELLRNVHASHVMHLGSEVEATLKPGLDALHAYAACLNMGTLTGAPKLRAMELLRGIEAEARGCWGGGFGVLRGDGSLDTAIVIRAAEVREGIATVRAGAGVVLDSVPQLEADETRRKAAAVLCALGATTVAA